MLFVYSIIEKAYIELELNFMVLHIEFMHWAFRTILVTLLSSMTLTCDSPSSTVATTSLPPSTPLLAPTSVPSTGHARPQLRPARVSATTLAVLDAGLASADWMVRLSSTQGLSCISSSQAIPRLEERLGDVEPDVRAAALSSLSRHGVGHARALIRSVQDDATEELSIRVLAASTLARPTHSCQ